MSKQSGGFRSLQLKVTRLLDSALPSAIGTGPGLRKVMRRHSSGFVRPLPRDMPVRVARLAPSIRKVTRGGVPADQAKAVEWWTKAANKGNAIAQYSLGQRLRSSIFDKDLVAAEGWFRKSA